MSDQNSTGEYYLARASKCRAKARETGDIVLQAVLLQNADTWERMAAWEDATHTGAAQADCSSPNTAPISRPS